MPLGRVLIAEVTALAVATAFAYMAATAPDVLGHLRGPS